MPAPLWLLTGLGSWLVGALYLDGWAHHHGLSHVDPITGQPSAFPYTVLAFPSSIAWTHLPFYAGVLAACAVAGVSAVMLRRRGGAVLHPPSWLARLLSGAGLMVLGTVASLVAPGPYRAPTTSSYLVEEALSQILGPASLLQAAGLLLLASIPLRSPRTMQGDIPAAPLARALGLLTSLSVLTYITQFVHPFVDPWPSADLALSGAALQPFRYGLGFLGQALGSLSILVQTALLMGVVLPALRRGRLATGTLTLVLTGNAALMAVLRDRYLFVGAAALTGLVADRLLFKVRADRSIDVRLFAFAVPALQTALYFIALTYLAGWGGMPIVGTARTTLGAVQGAGIGWSLQARVGLTLLAGTVGLLLASLIFPEKPAPAAIEGADAA